MLVPGSGGGHRAARARDGEQNGLGIRASPFAAPGPASRRKDAMHASADAGGAVVVVVVGSIRQRQATTPRPKQKERKERKREEFLQLTTSSKHERQDDPPLVSPSRCWCFRLPAHDCDRLCQAKLPGSLLWTVATSTAGDCNRQQHFS